MPIQLPREWTKNRPEKDVLVIIIKNLAMLNPVLTLICLHPVN